MLLPRHVNASVAKKTFDKLIAWSECGIRLAHSRTAPEINEELSKCAAVGGPQDRGEVIIEANLTHMCPMLPVRCYLSMFPDAICRFDQEV